MDICITCEEEIKDVYMYDSHELFCSDDCKEVNREDEIEREEHYQLIKHLIRIEQNIVKGVVE